VNLVKKHSRKANLPVDPLKEAWDKFRAYLVRFYAPTMMDHPYDSNLARFGGAIAIRIQRSRCGP
jgi:hypothetical protein